MGLFRRRPPQVDAVIARIRVNGAVHIEAVAPGVLQVPAGRVVEVKVPYSVEEAGGEREACVLRLVASLGGQPGLTDEATWQDHWGRPESLHGYLLVRLPSGAPRTARLSFRVQGTYTRQPWGRPADEALVDERRVEGDIQVEIT